MSEDRFTELAPLAALGVLDGEDLAGYRAHEETCPVCLSERKRHELVVARLGPLSALPPDPRVRSRLLAGLATRRRPVLVPLLAAACLVLGASTVGFFLALEAAKGREHAAEGRAQTATTELKALQETASFRGLVLKPGSRLAHLAAEASARGADACIVWNPLTGDTVLLAAGLPKPPEGKAYELWILSGELAPAPAGVFRVEGGKSVFHATPMLDLSQVKAFAVTVEPETGAASPTGPKVLTGLAS